MKGKFKAELEKFEDSLYPFHVKVPEDIYIQFSEAKIKRIMVSYNGGDQIHNALLPKGKNIYFIKLSKAVMKSQKLAVGDMLEIEIEEDKSKYGMPLAPEMKELLLQDVEGEQLFHKLTPGKIRSLLFKISGYKSSDKRTETAVIILEHLKANEGKLDWKMLNEAFKTGMKF